MKKHVLLILLTFLLFSQNSVSQNNKLRAVDLEVDRTNEGNITFTAQNKDYCDYYIVLEFPEIRGYTTSETVPVKKTVRQGNHKVMTLRRLSNSPSYSYELGKYWHYRGDIDAKLNLDYIYPLPVRTGDSVRVKIPKTGDYEVVFNLKHTGDTVYACRSGKVCDNDLQDSSAKSRSKKEKIIVYHKDKSFSEYSLFSKRLVHAGDYVEVGQPIAVVEQDEKGKKNLSFSVYYLDKNKVKDADTGKKHSSLVPTFHTVNNDDSRLEEKTTYVAELTHDLIVQEMSKKEREKYEKKLNKK